MTGKDQLYRFQDSPNQVVVDCTMDTPIGKLAGCIIFTVDNHGKLVKGQLMLNPVPAKG